MADDMRLLMHPDIGKGITDADLEDAKFTTIAETESAGSVSPRNQRPFRPSPLTANALNASAPIRNRALASSATAPSTSDGSSVRSSTVSAASSARPAKAKRASPAKKDKPKFASILAEKHDLIFRMNRMCTRGGKQSRSLSVNDSLEDLRCECERMQREIETEKSVKFQRSLMTSFATGVECLNARWNFAGLKLDGWSQSLQDDMDSYDEVFEELHAKYATKSVMPPEIKLVMMVASSAFMFHMSKSMFSSVPGMEEAMRDDPELAQKVAAAVAKKAHQNEPAGERRGMTGLFSSIMGSGGGRSVPVGAVGRPMSPPDAESVAGVERLFSDDGTESDAGNSEVASIVLDDDERGIILDT